MDKSYILDTIDLIKNSDGDRNYKVYVMVALLKKSKNVPDANFIECMACTDGCIGGAGCLIHGEKNKAEVDKYGREAYKKTIGDAVSILK